MSNMKCNNGMSNAPPCRALWKAEADNGKTYFRWTFGKFVLSVGKAWRGTDKLRHMAGPDTCEVLLFRKDNVRVDLFPSDVYSLLYPFDRYFIQDGDASPIAGHLPDSILDSLIYCLGYYLMLKPTEYKGTTL